MTLATITSDFMHVVDLGIAQVLLGNVLFELYEEIGTNGDALGDLLGLIRWAAKQLNMEPPIGKLTLLMFKSPTKRPKLKVKAAECRHLVPIVHKMLTLFPMGSEHSRMRFSCVGLLVDIYKEFDTWDAAKSPARIATAGRKHCILYAQLGLDLWASGKNEGRLYYAVLPKHHIFLHLVESQSYTDGNPKMSWAYRDESEIGTATKSAALMHTKTLMHETMDRYRLLTLASVPL